MFKFYWVPTHTTAGDDNQNVHILTVFYDRIDRGFLCTKNEQEDSMFIPECRTLLVFT